jgi:hypothetical protein
MPYCNNADNPLIVVNGVNYAIITYAQPPQILLAA